MFVNQSPVFYTLDQEMFDRIANLLWNVAYPRDDISDEDQQKAREVLLAFERAERT